MGIFEALSCWIRWLVGSLNYVMIEGVELVLDALAIAANLALSVLPTADLPEPDFDSGAVGALNYFLPIDVFLFVSTTIITAWIVYRIYLFALRWAKVEE